jgi:DNA (cytosine-5)-methyltransferase 1
MPKPHTDRRGSQKKPLIAIDLFAGAGGMSLGATMAGIDVKLAIEIDPFAAQTFALNHPQARVLQRDIRSIKKSDLPDKNGSQSIIMGGPPCQGFSTSNQKTRTTKNPNNWLFKEYLRLVNLWAPDWVVFENVTGLAHTADGLFLEAVQTKLESLGYALSTWMLTATAYGVPQRRARLFIVGSKKGLQLPEPAANSSDSVTVADAIDDLPHLDNGASFPVLPYSKEPHSEYSLFMRSNSEYAKSNFVTRNAKKIITRYTHIPQGGNWESIPARLMKNYKDRMRCHTGIYHRLIAAEPSVVIGNYRKNMLIHPTQNRGLSVREAARLQSFSDDFTFCGSIGFQQQQVGNAVPPLLAKAVFETINTSILGGR